MSIPTQRPWAAEAEAAGLQGASQRDQSGGRVYPISPDLSHSGIEDGALTRTPDDRDASSRR